MSKLLSISQTHSDPVLNIIFDTIKKNKQALIFVNTKRGAESQAEKIAMKTKTSDAKLINLSEDVLKAVSTPTKQCRRLSLCVKKGIAFHHSGLTTKQRELVEDNFRIGIIKIIACTPTLAFGLDLPAFRVIIRDLKRYGGPWGMSDIPVLEYEQQAGRAGRPGKEDYGEAICIATTNSQKEKIFKQYVQGVPEEIYSKLAVEPVLRTYVLSLIATEFVNDKHSLFEFFDRTFYAHQYADLNKLHQLLEKILDLLVEWGFLKDTKTGGESASKKNKDNTVEDDFVSADNFNSISSNTSSYAFNQAYEATILGRRVSELYLDPYTGNFIISCLRKATEKKTDEKTKKQADAFSYLQMITGCLELRPLLNVKMSEHEEVQGKYLQFEGELLSDEPTMFDEKYDEFLKTVKTALFFQDWINEFDEEYLFETYDVRPGEINAKREIADWLLYSSEEMARILKLQPLINDLIKLRLRLKYGAKEELLPLLKLKGVGRVRARKMYNNKLQNLTDIKIVDITTLAQLIGNGAAISVKKQLGQEFDPAKIKVRENKRKGQISLKDYEAKPMKKKPSKKKKL